MSSKSTFVNVLGWIMSVLFGFMFFITLLQNIAINMFFPIDEMQQSIRNDDFPGEFPVFIFTNLKLLFGLICVIILAVFVVSVAFLNGRNWGRIGLIIFFVFSLIYNISAFGFQFLWFGSIFNEVGPFNDDFNGMIKMINIASVIMTLGFTILFLWLLKKLTSDRIKSEFI